MQSLVDTFSILMIGFSICTSVMLYCCYQWFMHSLNKTPMLNASCAILLLAFCCIQYAHLQFFIADKNPMQDRMYLFWLFLAPPTFFIFFRTLLKPAAKFHPILLLNYVLFLVSFFVRPEITIPLLFMTGTAYSIWLAVMVYGLKDQRKQYRIEISFLVLFIVLAIGVLILGISLPYIEPRYFYYFYTFAIGIALLFTTAVLIINEDLPGEISEIIKSKYAASTLNGIDINEKLTQLEGLMQDKQLYADENLNLASLANEIDLSGHQLSELVNTRVGMSFSQYMRTTRVKAAKQLLINEPKASILAISLDTGFKSQSSFYSAFKDLTGVSPGAYRDKNRS